MSPWAKDSMKWTSAADVLLLREVAIHSISMLHPHEQKLAYSEEISSQGMHARKGMKS